MSVQDCAGTGEPSNKGRRRVLAAASVQEW